jgi:hypothetical protein
VAVAAAPPAALAPSPDSQLSEGVLVETSLLARLLGIRLLTVEGTVLLSPARLREGEALVSTPPVAPTAPRTRRLAPPARSAALGSRLAAAERLIADCGDTLRDLSVNGTGPGAP